MHGNINGGGGKRQAMSSVDFYRRVPKDLTEVSKHCVVLITLCLFRLLYTLDSLLDPIVALH